MQKLGVFWKIPDICYNVGTEIFKIEEEMTEKPQVANPHPKMGRIHFSQYGLLLMSLHFLTMKGKLIPYVGKIIVVLYPLPNVSSPRTLVP